MESLAYRKSIVFRNEKTRYANGITGFLGWGGNPLKT